jgi:heat shock protein HtpX
MAQYQELQSSNVRWSMVWVSVMAAITVGIGYAAGFIFFPKYDAAPLIGLAIAAVLAGVQALVAWFYGAEIVLAITGAKEITAESREFRQVWNLVEEMKIASGLPMPRVYVINDPAPNAFATGRNPQDGRVAVTTGLIEALDRDELQGVIAHEMAHISNRDILFQTVVGIMVGMIAIIADVSLRMLFWGGGRSSNREGGQAQIIILIVGIVFIILAPIVAQLVRFAISRQREYLADANGAQFTRNPEALASALVKISQSPVKLRAANHGMSHMWIIDPFKVGLAAEASSAFSTHPPVGKRIERLLGIGRTFGSRG